MVTQAWNKLKTGMDDVDLAVGKAAGYKVAMRHGDIGAGVYAELPGDKWEAFRPSLSWDDAMMAFSNMLSDDPDFILQLFNVLPSGMVDGHGQVNLRKLWQCLDGYGPMLLCRAVIGRAG